MSWLRWFRSDNNDVIEVIDAPDPGQPGDTTRPAPLRHEQASPAHRKGERIARREQLYGVVRESMVNAGVLTSTYKLKVLSLDSRARQFLLMVDLSDDQSRDGAQLAGIEAAIAKAAKGRHGIVVKAVYWRQQPVQAAAR